MWNVECRKTTPNGSAILLPRTARGYAFRADKYWSEWLATFHPLTRRTYKSSLFALMQPMNITFTQLIERAESNDKVTREQLIKKLSFLGQVLLALTVTQQVHSFQSSLFSNAL
jgi:hypothetical protein